MGKKQSKYPVGRIVIGSIFVVLLSIFLIFLIVTGYATYLAVEARGAPDQELINKFAEKIGSNYTLPVQVVLTYLAALWVKRKALPAKIPAGFIVAICVVVLGLLQSLVFSGFFNLFDLFW